MNFVKIISSTITSGKMMVKHLRMGKSDTRESKQITPFGVDSNPIKDTVAAYSETSVMGDDLVVGYVVKQSATEPGEIKIFAVNDEGFEQIYLHLKKNGDIWFGGNVGNLTRFQELQTAFNQLKSDFNSLVTTFNTHVHPETGVTTGPTPTPGSPSSADVSGAKIDQFKTL